MPVPARPGAGAPPFSEPPEPPRPPWPQPPSMPRPQRTEPVHIPTVVQPELACPDPERHYACASLPNLDPQAWEAALRERFVAGYRLLHVVPGDGTAALLVFEHRDA